MIAVDTNMLVYAHREDSRGTHQHTSGLRSWRRGERFGQSLGRAFTNS